MTMDSSGGGTTTRQNRDSKIWDKKAVIRAVQAWVRERQFHQARAILEDLRKRYPEDAEVLGEYAWVMARGFRAFEEAEHYIGQAIRLEVYNPRWYTIAARIYDLKGDRQMMIHMLNKAFEWDPNYPAARMLQAKVGVRRPPVFPFLPRKHILNRLLGKIRHALLTRSR